MNKQLVFFLALAFLFLIKGVVSMNLIMQLIGVTMLLFLIFDSLFNSKEYGSVHTRGISFVWFLGNVDLIAGILLLMSSFYGIILVGLAAFLMIFVFLKALVFVWGGDIASLLDIFSSVIVFSSLVIDIPSFILIGISVYLIQKGVLSFFS